MRFFSQGLSVKVSIFVSALLIEKKGQRLSMISFLHDLSLLVRKLTTGMIKHKLGISAIEMQRK